MILLQLPGLGKWLPRPGVSASFEALGSQRHGFKVSEDVLSASERQPTMLNVKVIISVYSWPASRTVVKQCSQASRDCMQL
mmetsp:Transcript_32705/g.67531  ORF Transcript_32705/g.67531 Transcript_32705/m.67531 type:complete len:81 (-) Transcript_32705:137-379(-)